MANIYKRESGSYQVKWRVGSTQRSKTFKTRAEAKRFAAICESEPSKFANVTLAEVADRYKKAFTWQKASAKGEGLRIKRIKAYPFAKKRLQDVTSADIEEFVSERMRDRSHMSGHTISASTLLKDLHLISALFNYAIRNEWTNKNPCKGIHNRPKEPEHRERIASESDIEALKTAAGWEGDTTPSNKTQMVLAAFLFACRTGMRGGEIMAIEPAWIEGRVLHLPKEHSKTGAKRDIALCAEALRILDLVKAVGNKPKYWGLPAPTKDSLWRKLRNKAGLGRVEDSSGNIIKEGLNFHDSRATFATWAAAPDPKTGAPRLDVLALARQTGHKDLAMLQRYYRASALSIADRLDA